MLSTCSPSLYAPLPTQPQRTGWCTINNIPPPFDSLQSTEHDWSSKQCTHLPALYVLFPWQQDLLYLLSSQLEPYPKTSEVPWHYFQEQAPEMKGKNQWFSHILFSNWHCISETYHYNFKFKGFLPYQLRHRELVGALIKPNDRYYNKFLMIEDLYGSYDSWIQIIQSVRIDTEQKFRLTSSYDIGHGCNYTDLTWMLLLQSFCRCDSDDIMHA